MSTAPARFIVPASFVGLASAALADAPILTSSFQVHTAAGSRVERATPPSRQNTKKPAEECPPIARSLRVALVVFWRFFFIYFSDGAQPPAGVSGAGAIHLSSMSPEILPGESMICRASSFVPPASLRIIVAGALLATGCETAPAVEESTTATQERLSFSANAWQASGPGNAVVSNADSALKFDYRLSGDAVWSSQTWTFSTTSDVEKTLAFNWSYSAYHAWYRVTANLEAFAEGPNGTTHVPLYSGGGGVMNASGTSTIAIHSGYRYGLRVTGSNYDRDTILTGSVIFAVPAPTKWTLGRVTNNTDAHVMFGLHVPKHGSVGVDALRDLTMVGLLIDGEGILGIDPRGELSGCANPVWRTPIKFGESAWSFYHNSGETLDITINPGPTFEFMPGSGGQVVAADQSPQCH